MKSLVVRFATVAAACSMVLSTPVSAAVSAQPASYSPWAALSALATPASSQALCGAAASNAAASASQAGSPGCVLPVVDAPPVVATPEPVPVPPGPPVGPGVVPAGGLGVIPLIAGLAVLAGAVALALGSGGDGGGDTIAISP